MARVTVIGSGFGGLATVRALRRRIPGAMITVIAPRQEFIYYPSLVGVPVGDRDASDVQIPSTTSSSATTSPSSPPR